MHSEWLPGARDGYLRVPSQRPGRRFEGLAAAPFHWNLMSANTSARHGRGCTSYAGPCWRIGLGVQDMRSDFFASVGLRQFVRLSLRIWAFGGLLGLFLPPGAPAVPAPDSRRTLQIYFVDVEGGQATLFVTPEGQSLLIDTGWPGNDGRDADRIVAAAKLAGISKIDYVLITHFHNDHVGGVPQLVARVPVGTFIDHGENRETTDGPTVQDWKAYQQVLGTGKFKRITAKPLPGAGQDNPYCKDAEQFPADTTENLRSLGTLINFDKLRILDLGDLTHDKEMQLLCPVNKIGKIDIYIVSHHGWSQSSSPAFVYGLAPRVAIMDNGAKKGGTPSVLDIIRKSPGLEDLWQLHFSEEGGEAHNVAAKFIANRDGPDAANYLELTAHPDG